jgi:hypothetical protein
MPPIAPPERLLVALFEVVAVEIWVEFAGPTVTAGLATADVSEDVFLEVSEAAAAEV